MIIRTDIDKLDGISYIVTIPIDEVFHALP